MIWVWLVLIITLAGCAGVYFNANIEWRVIPHEREEDHRGPVDGDEAGGEKGEPDDAGEAAKGDSGS